MNERVSPPDPDLTRTSSSAPAILTAGTMIAGRYEIRELVGIGGMGMLYRAHDQRLDIDIALKLLRPELVGEGGILARFESELLLGRQVTHRNVVRIHDIGQDGQLHFLTMDFVPGRSLKELLQDHNGPLPLERALAIALDIADAMAAAHSAKVIHRDLKPSNVLIDADDRAYVTDFGVARSLTGAGLTRTGQVVGTPEYLSPEQALGGTIDVRSDVYALGLILYEMISGKTPSQGESMQEVIAQRAVGRCPDLATTGVEVPAWLRRVVARCLEKDPSRRYRNAGTLARDLRAGTAKAAPGLGRRTRYALAAFGGIALGAGILFFAFDRLPVSVGDPPAATEPARFSIAILPIHDETGREDLAWIPTGIAEILASQLADSQALEIVDSRRVFQTLNDLRLSTATLTDKQIQQVTDLFGANRLISGTVRFIGGRLRVDATLLAGNSPQRDPPRFHAETADEGELFSLVDQLSEQVRRHLELPSPPVESGRPAAPAAALRAFSAGVDHLWNGDAIAARPQLELAVEKAPRFTEAWIRLAETYASLGYSDRALEAIHRAVSESGPAGSRLSLEARAQEAALRGEYDQSRALFEQLATDYGVETDASVGLAEAWGDEGHFAEAMAILEKTVARDANHPRAWYLLGKYAILSGDATRAVADYLVRALVIQNKLGNEKGKADALNALGLANLRLGQLVQAQENFASALAHRRSVGDDRGVAATLGNLANIAMFDGDFAKARDLLQEAGDIRERIGDLNGLANVLNTLGVLEEEQGRYSEALDKYRSSFKIREKLGDRRALAESFNNVGFAYLMLGEYDNAAVYWSRALEEARATGNSDGEMVSIQNLGLLALSRGDWELAVREFLVALESSRELGYTDAEAMSLGHLGRAAHFQGRYAAALSSYKDALQIMQKLGDPRGIAEFTLFRAQTLLEIGLFEEAQADFATLEALLADTDNREQRAALESMRGELALRKNQPGKAVQKFVLAKAAADASSSRVPRLRAAVDIARARLYAGEDVVAEIEAVTAESERVGHAVLTLISLETQSRALLATQRHSEALTSVRRLLAELEQHSPFCQAFRFRLLASDILAANDEPEAAQDEFAAAADELRRIGDLLPEAARGAFESIPDVRRLRNGFATR